jgi:hypothetical protein
VSEKEKQLIENYSSVDWCQAFIFQIQNEKAFNP